MGKRPAVIVAGGGIGGLSAALGLATKGCDITVLEQADQFGEIGAGKPQTLNQPATIYQGTMQPCDHDAFDLARRDAPTRSQ